MLQVDGGGGQWLVRMEWRPAGWSLCLPLLIFPCTIKSRSSLLAPAHPSGPGKRAIKWLLVSWSLTSLFSTNMAISETNKMVVVVWWLKCNESVVST